MIHFRDEPGTIGYFVLWQRRTVMSTVFEFGCFFMGLIAHKGRLLKVTQNMVAFKNICLKNKTGS